jgi:glycosyltransferase involved in cell wall biosynthesis
MFRPVVLIPVYNHPVTIGDMVHGVRAHHLQCLLVDDGSDPDCAQVLDQLARSHPDDVVLLRLDRNQGKGAAVMTGLRRAHALGYTHVLQIDADGQHDCADIPLFLSRAREHPLAVINGCPVYDKTVPRSRLYARYATHIWVWINTLSFDIRDSMCGFRVYPLHSVMGLLDGTKVGRRMDFDTEVVVRLHWRGLRVLNQRTRVTYPRDGLSHFRLLRDNLLISRMHAVLFLGMLWRAPMLLWRKAHQG